MGRVGLEPTNSIERGFTVPGNCHYAIYPKNYLILNYQRSKKENPAF